MAQDQTKKEALFNEVKGSLFEYLMARTISRLGGQELEFLESLDKNYLNVLSQQDRMVRQFYPEMLSFLKQVTDISTKELIRFLGETPTAPKLRGKFINSSLASELHEADLILASSKGSIPLSLKLNKKNAYVNTKSGGIKSFFTNYFDFISPDVQATFNAFVDQEFTRMSYELHAMNDMEFTGDYTQWVKSGKSELPGELSAEERRILKAFYARIAAQMHKIMTEAKKNYPKEFLRSLPALMGFSSPHILQLVCFHDFKSQDGIHVSIHGFEAVEKVLDETKIQNFMHISSVELSLGSWSLQIRVKPMNKFTSTAIKINCSVKFKQNAEI